jgi:hypothetical protein
MNNLMQTCPWGLGEISDVGVNINNITMTYGIQSHIRIIIKSGVCVYKLS